jgi:hypothetical protein
MWRMKNVPPPIAPERLDRELDRVGRLLRAADPAFRAPLDEAKAFSALDARRRGARPTLALLARPAVSEKK